MDVSQYLFLRNRQLREAQSLPAPLAVKQSIEELLDSERKQRKEWEQAARRLDVDDLIQSLSSKLNRTFVATPSPPTPPLDLAAIQTKVSHYLRLKQHLQSLSRQAQPPAPRPSLPTHPLSYPVDLSRAKVYYVFCSLRNDIPAGQQLFRAPLNLSTRESRLSIWSKTQEIEGEEEDETHLFQVPGNPFSVSETFSEFYESVWTKRTEAAGEEGLNWSYSEEEPLWEVACAAERRRAERNRKTLVEGRQDEWLKAALEPLGLRLYRPVCPPTSKEVPATDASLQYGSILKYAFLRKRKGEQRKFHKRFIVLRGFRLYWYRNCSGNWAKGVLTVPTDPIARLRVNGQACFSLHRSSKGSLFTILEDSLSQQWPTVLDNQSAYRALIEDEGLYHDFHAVTGYFLCMHGTELRVQERPLLSRVMDYISRGLAAHLKLQVVALVSCQLTDESISPFLTAISGTIRLESLDLSKNQLTHLSASKIADLIKQEESQWNALMHLSLSDNPIADAGVDLLSRAFRVRFHELFKPHSLHSLPFFSLCLSGCSLSDSGLISLYSMLEDTYAPELVSEPRLTLDLSRNSSSEVSFQRLICLLPSYQPLQALDISHIGLLPAVLLSHFLSSLVTNFSLATLCMTGLPLSAQATASLLDLLSDNYVLTEVKVTMSEEGLKTAGERFREVKPVFTLMLEES